MLGQGHIYDCVIRCGQHIPFDIVLDYPKGCSLVHQELHSYWDRDSWQVPWNGTIRHVSHACTIWRKIIRSGRGGVLMESRPDNRRLQICFVCGFSGGLPVRNGRQTLWQHTIPWHLSIWWFCSASRTKRQERVRNLAKKVSKTYQQYTAINSVKFTVDLWNPGGTKEDDKRSKITVNTDEAFPFLDIKFLWSNNELLQTQVHLKPNQNLKYLNANSAHTNACLKSILNGVIQRLTKLTSLNRENRDRPIDLLYLEHANALRKSRIVPSKFPILSESLGAIQDPPNLSKQITLCQGESTAEARACEKKQKNRERSRSTFFV